jgi:hypothetical protein
MTVNHQVTGSNPVMPAIFRGTQVQVGEKMMYFKRHSYGSSVTKLEVQVEKIMLGRITVRVLSTGKQIRVSRVNLRKI